MLELRNISYKVPTENGEKQILKNISLKIDERFVVITGPNGSGKSTLAKLIAGIVTPTEGQVILNGEDITHMSITDRAKAGISFAFQRPVKFKGITVKDLIDMAAGKELTVSQACSYLSEVGLCARDYVNREANGLLSGGELKRIEIAMILARSTQVSIFDEPEAGIDLWSFNSLIRVFESMHENIKGQIMIISHQERILDIADKIVLLKDGEIQKIGTKDEIMPLILGSAQSICPKIKE